MFCKEVIGWKALRHPNVLPLLGVAMSTTEFAMVSKWMSNGDINRFVREHLDVNRFELVSLPRMLPVYCLSLTIGWFCSWETSHGV